jgi:predicted transposase/invertase (TIGR01784 family)
MKRKATKMVVVDSEESEDDEEINPSKIRKEGEEEYLPSSDESSSVGGSPKRIINPTIDTPFKKICYERDLLISLLNTFLQLTNDERIQSIEYLPQESQPEILGFKVLRFDIICTDQKDRTFVVEMQNLHEPSFVQRTVYYCSKVYSSSLRKGVRYSSTPPVRLLVFLNFEMFKTKKYLSHYILKDKEDNKVLTEDFQITYVEIPKYNKEEPETIEDEWMYLFKDYKKKGEIKTRCKEVEAAFEILKSLSPEELAKYDEELKNTLDIEGMVEEAKDEGIKIGEEKGIKIGEEKGRKIGEEKGIKIGEEKGIKIGEEKGKEEVALKLIEMGLKDAQIMEASGLTKQKIQELKAKK